MAGIGITLKGLTAAELRFAAGRTKDARAARRMLAIALVLGGWTAKRMTTLAVWVEAGPDAEKEGAVRWRRCDLIKIIWWVRNCRAVAIVSRTNGATMATPMSAEVCATGSRTLARGAIR